MQDRFLEMLRGLDDNLDGLGQSWTHYSAESKRQRIKRGVSKRGMEAERRHLSKGAKHSKSEGLGIFDRLMSGEDATTVHSPQNAW